MARSKSPDLLLEKPKSRVKSLANNLAFSNCPSSANLSKIFIHSTKNRNDSISHNRSSKLLKRKRSLNKFRIPISSSPSYSKIHVKDDLSEKSQSPAYFHTESLKNIESILMKIQIIDEKSLNDFENIQILTVNNERFELFNEIFELIIEKDRIFGKYLKKIKDFYDVYNDQVSEKHLKSLQKSQKKLENEKNSLIQERESYQKLLENLSRENFKLSKELDTYEEEIEQLQLELKNVQNVDFESVPANKDSWKHVLKQNKYYKDKCQSLQSEVQVYKHNQEVFIRKFEELKEQGIDVYYEYAEEAKSSSRGSVVILELPKNLKKTPLKVPDLRMNNVTNFP